MKRNVSHGKQIVENNDLQSYAFGKERSLGMQNSTIGLRMLKILHFTVEFLNFKASYATLIVSHLKRDLMKTAFHLCFIFLFTSFFANAQDFDSYIGSGGFEGVEVLSSDNHQRPGWDFTASADKTISGEGLDYAYMTAARFLDQAALGAESWQIEYASQFADNFEGWIDEQVDVPGDRMLPRINQMLFDVNTLRISNGYDSTELFDRPNWQLFNYTWWQTNMTNNDLLRQRMAYALSQILVISMNSDLESHGLGTSDYYDIFLNNAFGNYKDILREVTLHPTMGFYLSHLNNPRSIPSENIHPDENYAREIMQLFSIGLYELNNDGSRKKDGDGNDIPTYTQEDITELAKVFTGLGVAAIMPNMYIDEPEFGVGIYLGDLTLPMKMYEEWHEPGQKTILGNNVIPDGQSGMKDIDDALDIIFNHPNVGPFIARRLIQHMVKSNPTPGYVERVATTFNNDGNGTRGNMLAVIKAILLDDEARSCASLNDPNHGKLTEPFLRYTKFARFIPKLNINNRFWNVGYNFYEASTQSPLTAPTVFNFFLPDYQPNGNISDQELYGPEFQIHNSRTSVEYINEVNAQAIWTYLMDDWEENSPPTYANYDELERLGRDSEAIVNYLDKNLTRGMMSEDTRNIIKTAIDPLIYGDFTFDRLRLAAYLTLISPDYTVLR